MPLLGMGRLSADASLQDLIETVAKMQKALDYLLQGGLDSKNAREFGGWRVNNDELVSKDGDVGMSTADTGADDVRFWAGDAKDGTPKFKVTKAGIATLVEMILASVASGQRVVIDSTGFHTYDASGVERLTIGTTPAKGAKALIGRDAAGTEQSVYTYDTEMTYEGTKTGQFMTAHGAYVLLENNGDVYVQAANGYGIRATGSRPELNDGFGWDEIAKKSEVDVKATAGVSTSSGGGATLNGGIPIGTVLTVSGGGTVTWAGINVPSHSHTQN